MIIQKNGSGAESDIFISRIDDLINAAGHRGAACSGFLDSAQQHIASEYLKKKILRGSPRYFFYGGYGSAQRRLLVLISPELLGCEYYCGRCLELPDGDDLCILADVKNAGNYNGNSYEEISTDGDLPAQKSENCGYQDLPDILLCDNALECAGIKAVLVKGSGYEQLDHRSFMGAVLALGLSRDTVGDIIVRDGREAIIFTVRAAAELLLSQPPVLTYVGRDKVRLSEIHIPPDFEPHREYVPVSAVVASARLDAVVAGLAGISREKAKCAVARGDVALNSVSELRPDFTVCEGTVVSVRGFGKFRIKALGGSTRSGRLKLAALKFK